MLKIEKNEVESLNVVSTREEGHLIYLNVPHLTLNLCYKPRKSYSDHKILTSEVVNIRKAFGIEN